MEKAESSGAVPTILCDAEARQQMTQRLADYGADFRASKSLTSFSKVTLYAAAQRNLASHSTLLKLAPAANKEKVVAPVFIVSPPRSATTILHRTMSQDRERWRNFDLCDMVRPIPPVSRDDEEGRKQCAEDVEKELGMMDMIFPGYKSALETMHGFHPGEADEDLGWYNVGLGHLFMDVLMLLHPEQRAKPGGISPLESSETAKYRFAFLDLVMRIYQSIEPENNKTAGQSDKPWLMKDPNHAAHLPELLAQFPDAKLVFAHRPPLEIVASLAKLFVVFSSTHHIAGAPGTTSKEWGGEAVQRMTGYLQGPVDFTKAQAGGSELALSKPGNGSGTWSTRRIDFQFRELVQDVPAAIKQIYAAFYSDRPPPTGGAMRKFNFYLEQYARHKTGKQPRSLEDFHISSNGEKVAQWEEYTSLFLET
jgi:hypothetical protein